MPLFHFVFSLSNHYLLGQGLVTLRGWLKAVPKMQLRRDLRRLGPRGPTWVRDRHTMQTVLMWRVSLLGAGGREREEIIERPHGKRERCRDAESQRDGHRETDTKIQREGERQREARKESEEEEEEREIRWGSVV